MDHDREKDMKRTSVGRAAAGLNRLGFIPRSLLRFRNGQSKVRYSRMF